MLDGVQQSFELIEIDSSTVIAIKRSVRESDHLILIKATKRADKVGELAKIKGFVESFLANLKDCIEKEAMFLVEQRVELFAIQESITVSTDCCCTTEILMMRRVTGLKNLMQLSDLGSCEGESVNCPQQSWERRE